MNLEEEMNLMNLEELDLMNLEDTDLMNLQGATQAIIATPEQAVALMQLNAELGNPYQVKGAYMIWSWDPN